MSSNSKTICADWPREAIVPIDPDADILARTMCGEARGEGDQGMIAVANVVMNRVAKPCWWGKTIRQVCLKPYQFSCWLHDDPNYPIIENLNEQFSIYNDAVCLAKQVMAGDIPDNTNGATSYYAKSMAEPPSWAADKTPCAVIGNHLFFVTTLPQPQP